MSSTETPSGLADLFPGFASHFIDTKAGRLFARSGGSGPPLLLLHGYPQTHAQWHKIAADLAQSFHVVLMDLRGYGASFVAAGEAGALYTKRLMAEDAIEVMRALGFTQFYIAGHDRGGRVAYRLALDHPEHVLRLAVLDIVPTAMQWRYMDAQAAMRVYHWMFLAQPAPFPETLIGGAPLYYLEHTLKSWSASKSLDFIDPEALAHYKASFSQPDRLHASCEDYRAGATIDRDYDEADLAAGKKIGQPLLVLWGARGLPGGAPLDIWREFGVNVQGQKIESGHFLPEENPQATLAALLEFFTAT
jgi:haloacetate dehalogenase